MKSIIRFLAFAFAAVMLVVLTNCTQTPNADNSSNSSPAATSSPAETSATNSASSQDQININSAILSELDKLEAKLGVPALSNKIQASRPYGSTEELVSKQVITQEQYDQIKDMVTVEDIVLTGEAKDVDYMAKLGLMKGHLLVAQELLAQGKPDQAEPHIGHPVEEIYVDVEEQFQERNVPDFKNTLIGLQDLLKSKPEDPKIASQFQESMQAVDNAIEGLSAQERQSPEFVLKVIAELLDAAGSEYQAAIADGKISAAIEYQDSRGFVTYADTLYSNVSEVMSKEHPDAHQAITDSMAKLKTAWPSAIPPATPVLPPEDVSQEIKTIEQNSQKAIA